MIPIAVCTVDRPEGYVHRTLESLLASDAGPQCDVHLCVGCPDASYLARYEGQPRLTIHPLSAGECQQMWSETIHTRFNRNYLRCLQRADERGVVVLEDDIVLRPSWFACLQEAISELESRVAGPYVLALYYSRVGLAPRGRAFCSYIASTFYGTQALYFPAASAVGFAEFLQQHLVGLGSADMVLRAWCMEHQNLYATTRALAQHMGIVTTGLAGHMHQAWNFDESWPAA